MINGHHTDWIMPGLLVGAIMLGVFLFGGKTTLLGVVAFLSVCVLVAGGMHLVHRHLDVRRTRNANKPSEGTR